MSELAPLIEDLAFILVLAGIVTIFCKKFNQPLVLGYILAGFFASPHFNLLPNVVDTANITVWSDIGVIFILFSLGLDFNFAKIKSIGGTALIAAVTELTGITLLGYACARLLGWQPIDSLFAGAMLTMSSTAVVSKTFEELGLLKERFTQFTFGILVLEDISGIIMMVDALNHRRGRRCHFRYRNARQYWRTGLFSHYLLCLRYFLPAYLLPQSQPLSDFRNTAHFFAGSLPEHGSPGN